MSTKLEVVFKEKSQGQEDDCINQSDEYKCPNKSTLEAQYGVAVVRCCTDERCKTIAAALAKKLHNEA